MSVTVAAVLVAGLALWHERHYVNDDAFITLRYVERWLTGHGLTWNDGKHVEGFTHPLWLLQIAALGAIGVPLETAARFLGAGYFAAGLWLLARSRAWPFALLLVATQPG